MKKIKNIAIWLLILVGCGLYGVYNHAFIRQDQDNKVYNFINPISYENYFFAQQSKPNSFFTASMFPQYTQWCHENRKLCSILPLQQFYADIQWLGSIQFIGSQGGRDGIDGLASMLDNLTTLAPYRSYPYTFGQLLIPLPKGDTTNPEEVKLTQGSWNAAKSLAEKGEYYTCDGAKIENITRLSEEEFINIIYGTGDKSLYENPCPRYELPHYAAFNAFYYRNDAENAGNQYKISAFTEGSPGLTPLMTALVYGRGGEHLKSATLWYDRYISLITQGSQDDILANDAERALKKAVFEIQLQIITDADEQTQKSCQQSYDCLVKKGAIKNSISNSYNTICKKGTETNNIRCILLQVGLDNHWITLAGGLTYPLEEGFIFAWHDGYQSRWITPVE